MDIEVAGPRRRILWWVELVLAAAAVAAGLLLLTRPFASIGVLVVVLGAAFLLAGAAQAWQWFAQDRRWWLLAIAVLLAAVGAIVLAAPGLTVRTVVILVGIALIVSGVVDLVRGLGRRLDGIADALSGAAGFIFGVLALAWPDVTVLAVGVLFGVWLIVTGVRLAIAALRRRPGARPAPARVHRRWPGIVLGAVALAAAIALAVVGVRLTGHPVPDAFYSAPDEIPDRPGILLRAEPFAQGMQDGASAWRILYTTTRADGVPAISSGVVIVPEGADAPPTIAWAHGTTGVAAGCAPSLAAEPMTSGAMPDLEAALGNGWAVVATDYVGLGADPPHPYLVGEAEGRSVLDAVRASRQLEGLSFGEEVVVWGHSQGGGAALWTGGLAPLYAPELDVVGVVAMAPAANLPAMAGMLADGKAGTLVGPLILAGYSAAYPEVRIEDYVRPQARLLVEETIARCWTDPSVIVSALQAGVIDMPIWARDPASGPLGDRVAENVPRLAIPAPLLIAQGLADPLVLPEAQQQYVDSLCAAGQVLEYRTYPGRDHMGVVTGDSPLLPELLRWTQDRLDGAPAADTC